ncbi:MAG: helix-turn-helix transcriptional regulator [Candidatus Dormibacteria bacterium]
MAERCAALIRDARVRAGLTQRELARRAGTSQAVVSAYENEQREPGYTRLETLIAAAGFELRVELHRAEDVDSDEDDDRILENLRLTPSQRLRKMGALRGFTDRYRGVLARKR